MDELQRLRAAWGVLGEDDPLWAILSDPQKRGGGWDLDAFFASGEAEVAALLQACDHLGLAHARGTALDFGCGVGRLSRALATRFDRVVGVDISASMLAHARRLNADRANIAFVENAAADLRFVADRSVDLIYSVITLQHAPEPLQLGYIAEFMRVLATDGLAVFQTASGHSRDWRGLVHRWVPNALLNPLRRHWYSSRAAFEMHVLAEEKVRATIVRARRRIVRVEDDACAGAGFVGRRFFVS
ncbi:MAG: class I SAM-dependent methyltransferase [Rudaea sp.]